MLLPTPARITERFAHGFLARLVVHDLSNIIIMQGHIGGRVRSLSHAPCRSGMRNHVLACIDMHIVLTGFFVCYEVFDKTGTKPQYCRDTNIGTYISLLEVYRPRRYLGPLPRRLQGCHSLHFLVHAKSCD